MFVPRIISFFEKFQTSPTPKALNPICRTNIIKPSFAKVFGNDMFGREICKCFESFVVFVEACCVWDGHAGGFLPELCKSVPWCSQSWKTITLCDIRNVCAKFSCRRKMEEWVILLICSKKP